MPSAADDPVVSSEKNDKDEKVVIPSQTDHAVNQLTDNAQLFRSLLEYSNDIIMLNDPEGIITYISPSIKKVMGYEEQEMLGRPGFDFIHPDFKNELLLAAASVQHPGGITRCEVPFLHKDGNWRWVESNISNLLHIPQINAFVSNFRDITERKKITEELLYGATLIENIADAVIGTDLNYIINSWNKGAEKMYGWKPEEVLGKEARLILRTKFETPEGQALLYKILNEHEYWQGEVEQQRRDGTTIPVLASVAFVKDKNGNHIGTVAVNRDITEQKTNERLLNETKTQIELTFNHIPALIYLFDNRGELLFANKRAAEVYGYASVADLMNEKDLSNIRKKAMATFEVRDEEGQIVPLENSATAIVLRTGIAKELIFRSTHKLTGVVTWILSTASPLFGKNGELSMVLTTSTDITLQKNAEKEIRQSEERFRTLAEALPQLVWTTDSKGVQEYTSGRWEEYTGLDPSRENIWAQIVHPEDMNSVMEIWSASLATGSRYNAEIRIKTKAGVYHWNYIQGEPVKNDSGDIVKWVGAFTDIHAQKIAEQKIRQSQENFQQLADLVPQIIWTSRPDGHLDYYNKRWYEFTGFKEGFGDQSWTPILHPDDVQFCIDTWYNSVKTGEPYMIEYRFLDKTDGTYRWFLGKGLPVRDNQGGITKWFGTCTDIHDQRIATEKLEQLVKQRTIELQRSNEDLQQFAHVTSHDMKEPLRKIQTFGSRLLASFGNQLPDEGKKFVEKMNQSAARLASMIDAVLKYSTVNATEEAFEETDLNNIVYRIQVDLEVAIQQKNAAIICGVLPIIESSQVLMHQLFYNLINNSLKFASKERNTIINIKSRELSYEDSRLYDTEVDGNKNNKFYEITIEDNGIGFNQKYAEKIFKTFSRLHSRSEYEGTGLGLALCKKIIWRHKGFIYASGQENKGACFTIILPLHQR